MSSLLVLFVVLLDDRGRFFWVSLLLRSEEEEPPPTSPSTVGWAVAPASFAASPVLVRRGVPGEEEDDGEDNVCGAVGCEPSGADDPSAMGASS